MSVGSFFRSRSRGFTIVELLIVITVIGILAAIVIVAYNGIQTRARDSRRQDDVQVITQALELYYTDNNQYPTAGGSAVMGASWSTTADASWQNLVTALKPYLGSVPADPISTAGVSLLTATGFNYAYRTGANCGTTNNQMYLLVYRFESASQVNTLSGTCTSGVIGPYAGDSNYRVSKL